ncbi:MAG: hypothetical protein HC915_13920 [Anaerolineae bacterium]|nr:hypothetical protein [Anaerolineae bacterium]
MAPHPLPQRLRRVFHCTEADLRYNRRGVLSPRQRRRLQAYRCTYWAGIGGLAGTPVGVLGALWGLNLRRGPDAWLVISLLIIGWGLAWLLLDLTQTARQSLREDLRANQVRVLAGAVRRLPYDPADPTWKVWLNNTEVTVNLPQYLALQDHFACRMFCAPRFGLVLAVEPL